MSRSIGRLGWGSSGDGSDLTEIPADLQPQWIPAGAWTPDPANSLPSLIEKNFGVSPGGTFSAYTTIDLPQVSVGGAQYWYYTAAPPLSWDSNQIQFAVHFIVEDAISLPGGYRFTLGGRRQQDVSVVLGAKTSGNVDYDLSDSNVPRYRITSLSSAITIASAVAGEGLHLELTRGVNPTSEESDSTFIVGIELHYV